MAPLNFPTGLIRVRHHQLDIFANVISGGMTSSGLQQLVNTSGGGLWRLQVEFERLKSPDQVRAWRVMQYGQAGGVVPVNLSICDLRHAPRPSGWMSPGSTPHSDGTFHSDGTGYSVLSVPASVADAIDVRATAMRLALGPGSRPQGGEFFSMAYGEGQHELHVVLTAAQDGDFCDITFTPPARAAHAPGDTVNFDRPTCTFRLAGVDGMAHTLMLGRLAEARGTFVEWIGGA